MSVSATFQPQETLCKGVDMSDIEQKIAHLEDIIEKMQLDAHASRVAIAVLSTSLNGLMGKDAKLGDMYLNSIAQADSSEIDNKVSDDYIAKLNEKVATLLGTQQ
ncbi:hypothetical protein L0417_001326 [Salmonella enterica]|nr:hypothetical protein [Salmonella enterica]